MLFLGLKIAKIINIDAIFSQWVFGNILMRNNSTGKGLYACKHTKTEQTGQINKNSVNKRPLSHETRPVHNVLKVRSNLTRVRFS